MTTKIYTPPSFGSFNPDIFGANDTPGYGHTPLVPDASEDPLVTNKIEFERVPSSDHVMLCRITLADFRGGDNNCSRGLFSETQNKSKRSTADARYKGHLILPIKTKTLQSPVANANTGSIIPPFSYNAFADYREYIGFNGLTAGDKVLFKETSLTDPTPLDTQYDPNFAGGQYIVSLQSLVIGGASNAPRLVVGRQSAPAQVITSTATPPAHTDMAAISGGLYGAVQTTKNDNAILGYSLGGGGGGSYLWLLGQNAAIADTPSTQESGVPSNGYCLGLLALANAPLQVFWMFPKGAVIFGNYDGHIFATDEEGQIAQEIHFPLKTIYSAGIVRGGIWATDGERICWYNGKFWPVDLKVFADPVADSDRFKLIVHVWVRDEQELIVEALDVDRALTAGAVSRTMRYNWELRCWQNIATAITLTKGNVYETTQYAFRGGAYSKPTSRRFNYASDSHDRWRFQYVPPPEVNPFTLRQTGASTNTDGPEFEATAVWESPDWLIDGVAFCPKEHKRSYFLGDVDAGGTGATVQCEILGPRDEVLASDTWGAGWDKQVQGVDSERGGYFDLLRVRLTLTQGSSTYRTPQALPIVIEFYCHLDGIPAVPFRESDT